MFKPRKYQEDLSDQGAMILWEYNIFMLVAQMRIGKTIIGLMTAEKFGATNVLFVTRKKAISSIQNDYKLLNPDFELTVINYESVHKVPMIDFDVVVADEFHNCIVPGSVVSGKRIEDIQEGDEIDSYNELSQTIEKKKVVKKFTNEISEDLIKIKANGKEIICTRSHRIFTKRGWVDAGSVRDGDELLMV